MRFLADENFPGDAVAALRSTGHDVTWVRTAMPGSADADILETAQRERRVLLTFDRDFGELAWRQRARTSVTSSTSSSSRWRPTARAAVEDNFTEPSAFILPSIVNSMVWVPPSRWASGAIRVTMRLASELTLNQ